MQAVTSNSDKAASPSTPPVGQLFTSVYLERGKPTRDSAALRARLGGYFGSRHFKDRSEYTSFIKVETGESIRVTSIPAGYYYGIEDFFAQVPLPKLLNVITLTWRFLRDTHPTWIKGTVHIPGTPLKNVSEDALKWRWFVARAFHEENLGYKLDEQCGVHFLQDAEFERSRAAVVACLQRGRYAAVLDAFETAHRHLDAAAVDTKACVRSLFESLEILVRLMIETKNLNRWIVENKLKPMAVERCGDDAVTRRAIEGVYDGLADWVDGLHIYRHGQPVEVPVAPTTEFAVYVLSSGAAYLRLIAELDQSANG